MGCAINGSFRVSIVLDPPWTQLKSNADHLKDNDRYEGYCIDVLQELALLCNFTYLLVEAPQQANMFGNMYGEYSNNGTWAGLVGEVARGNVALGAGIIRTTYRRSLVIDYLPSLINEARGFMMHKDRPLTPSIFSIVAPLTGQVWGLTGLAVLVFSASLWIISIITSPYAEDKLSAAESFWFLLTTLLAQGNNIEPQNLSTKVLSATWWFFRLILAASYTGNLAAFLTVGRTNAPIKSFEDLLKQSNIKYGALYGSETINDFQSSKHEVYQQIWAHMRTNPSDMVTSYSEGFQRVKAGGYAFIADISILNFLSDYGCDTELVEEPSATAVSSGFIVPKDSPHKDMLSRAMIQILDKGTAAQMLFKWLRLSSNIQLCTEDKAAVSKALDTENLAGIFVILAIGLVVAYTIAFLERIVRVMKHMKYSCGMQYSAFLVHIF